MTNRMTNEEAAAILESEAEYLYSQDEPYNRQAFKMAIDALQERKTGKWIKTDEFVRCGSLLYPNLRCSLCEKTHDVITKYCPNCGAKMEVDNATAL